MIDGSAREASRQRQQDHQDHQVVVFSTLTLPQCHPNSFHRLHHLRNGSSTSTQRLQADPNRQTYPTLQDTPQPSVARSATPTISSIIQLTNSAAIRSLKATAATPAATPQSAHARRNRHAKTQEILGDRPRARQTTTHECNHDVHVRQFSADLQHHDGIHAVQEPDPRAHSYESDVYEV